MLNEGLELDEFFLLEKDRRSDTDSSILLSLGSRLSYEDAKLATMYKSWKKIT